VLRESGLGGLEGQVSRVDWRPAWLEAACVGWETAESQPGPLLVAALRHDPPHRSVQFWVTLGALTDGTTLTDPGRVTAEEAAEAVLALERLATPRLVPLAGRGADHGLVWLEGSLDHATTPWLPGRTYREVWPEGDGEAMLRRFIEDSVEVLTPTEANRRRRDEGRPELNIAWPWGGGFRPEVPHLALRHAAPVRVESRSWTVQGLARLGGLPHGEPEAFGRRLATDWARLADLDGPGVDRRGMGRGRTRSSRRRGLPSPGRADRALDARSGRADPGRRDRERARTGPLVRPGSGARAIAL
jgi:hypothetical protein